MTLRPGRDIFPLDMVAQRPLGLDSCRGAALKRRTHPLSAEARRSGAHIGVSPPGRPLIDSGLTWVPLTLVTGDRWSQSWPGDERRVVPRIDHRDYDTVLDYDPRAKYAALAFVGPRADIPSERGDWLMTLTTEDWTTVYVCVIGPGFDFPDPASAITASEIALSQGGYRFQRTPVDAHLTAAWELERR